MPSGPGIRVDTAVVAGSRVAPDYDPLIAKLMVVDESRDAAIGRLARALDETTITGVQTTLPFHRFIAADPGFRAGDLSIDWVDREWAAIAERRRRAAFHIAAHAAAAAASVRVPIAAPATGPGAAPATPTAAPTPSPSSGWAAAGRARAVDRWPR
jgi:acetyl/propionyl-CoA carboxylase alpha subunit